MARRSSRLAGSAGSSSPAQPEKSSPAGDDGSSTKRKAAASEGPKKRGRPKKQKTLEETVPQGEYEQAADDAEMKDTPSEGPKKRGRPKKQKTMEDTMPEDRDEEAAEDTEMKDDTKEEDASKQKTEDAEAKGNSKGKRDPEVDSQATVDAPASENGAVEESAERKEIEPSNILEKGIIYFFTRGRVGVEEPKSVADIQRSYIVLRPLPEGAKLNDGPIQDLKNNRLIAVPKKVLPKSHRDRFMAFVEKANTTVADLKDNFMKGSEYETKTKGTQHTPPVNPIGEGVYAITSTGQASGRNSHLAYMLTIPGEPGEIQKELGIRSKGSFITSLKNPTRPGQANLPKPPEFPKDIIEEFHGLAWMGLTRAEQLNYENAQILLIGEAADDLGKAAEPANGEEENKETPGDELEQLEHEDELRVEHLRGEGTVFDDLKISKDEYPSVMTTWWVSQAE